MTLRVLHLRGLLQVLGCTLKRSNKIYTLLLESRYLLFIILAFSDGLVTLGCYSFQLLFQLSQLLSFLGYSAAVKQVVELVNEFLVTVSLQLGKLHLPLLVLLPKRHHLVFQTADCVYIFLMYLPTDRTLVSQARNRSSKLFDLLLVVYL